MRRHNRRLLNKMLEQYRRNGKVNGMKLLSEADVYILWKSQIEAQMNKERKGEEKHGKFRNR